MMIKRNAVDVPNWLIFGLCVEDLCERKNVGRAKMVESNWTEMLMVQRV